MSKIKKTIKEKRYSNIIFVIFFIKILNNFEYFLQNKNESIDFKRLIIDFLWKALFFTISLALIAKEKLIELGLGLYFGDIKTSVASLTDENLFLSESATQLAQKIREKKLTSYQLISAAISRLNQVNKIVNAIVDGPFEEALEEAKRIDERIAAGLVSKEEFSQKLFLGVPITIKDSVAVAGKLHTFGAPCRKSTRAQEDAECIKMIRKSGAIIVATTNVPDGLWYYLISFLYDNSTHFSYELGKKLVIC